jgi:uncharacterized membrane protein YkvA (DUF1232 family)
LRQTHLIDRWKVKARQLKVETYALYLAYKDPRVPRHARWFTALVVGYAFSPIDLIPDFIPVLGYVDDLVLVPLGVVLALRMMPGPILAECRLNAEQLLSQGKPENWTAVGVIIGIWVLVLSLIIVVAIQVIRRT